MRTTQSVTIALTGAPCSVTVGGRARDLFSPVAVAAGEVVEIGMPSRGVRTYVAFHGGLASELVLGSASTDLLSHVGPEVVRDGDRLQVGQGVGEVPAIDLAPVRQLVDEPVLRVTPGPRADWFIPGALELLGRGRFVVTSSSDRVGARLDGPVLERSRHDELPSEGMVEGAVQVPPDGRPVIFLADHPVTGGYPVIAVVHSDDVAVAAQLRPGQPVRFEVASIGPGER